MIYSDPNDFWHPGEPDMYKDLEDDERIAVCICHIICVVITCLIVFILLALFSSCTTTQYVPVIETHENHHWHTDSVKEKDSVIHERTTTIMQLDSVGMAQYGIRLKAAERAWLVQTSELERQIQELARMVQDRDTVHDSIPVPYPVETIKEIEKPLAWWQKTLMYLGGLIVIIFGIWVWRTK